MQTFLYCTNVSDDIKFRVSFIEVYRLFENTCTKNGIDMVYDRYCLS